MHLQSRLDQLQSRVARALRSLPGATALHLLGSRAATKADPYSDIDLQVLTADLEASRSIWPQFLECVAPIDVALPLGPESDNTAFAVLFHGENPYHKVDIGLSSAGDAADHHHSEHPHTELWSQTPAPMVAGPRTTSGYVPSVDTNGYAAIDTLMGCIRYARARKRGHLLTCWRFLRSMAERFLQLAATRQEPQRPPMTVLTTWDYRALDLTLPSADRSEVVRHLDWSSGFAMDRGCLWFAHRTIAELSAAAAKQGEEIPRPLIDSLLAFLRDELRAMET